MQPEEELFDRREVGNGLNRGARVGRGAVPNEPIAIVGAACRLPCAPDLESFWQLLCDGRSAVVASRPFGASPRDHEERLLAPRDRATVRAGAFLEGVDLFDAEFFGIPPRQAASMDPQQRLIMELSWEALEDAGTVPAALRGTPGAVYMAAMWDDYAALAMRRGPQAIDRYTMTGLLRGLIANRVSHFYGLRGPSMTVDTGQSGGLVAVHMACEALHRDEADLALVGGVNLNLSPERALSAARSGALSDSGLCYTFDARADGYARGEGAVVLVLKRLSRAVSDDDEIYCVIEGSAVNCGSADEGLSVPSVEAQRDVIQAAYARGNLGCADIQYVELHGTGTAVGDPIEAAALSEAFDPTRRRDGSLLVGSAKTNVGHLEAAAGLVGLLKTALSISRRTLPASLNFETVNPRVAQAAPQLRVHTATGPWPEPERRLAAGVSSFGMGGTNCHVILAERPSQGKTAAGRERALREAADSVPLPWLLSARSPAALRAHAQRLRAQLLADEALSLADVGYTLATRRAHLDHRAVIVGSDRGDFVQALAGLATDEPVSRAVVRGVASEPGRIAFVFPGHGSQWAGMGRDLMRENAVFAEWMRACDAALARFVGWSVLDVLHGAPGAPPLERADAAQAALFAVNVSLAQVWRSYGVEPEAVVGHSLGEIAACFIAGGLSLDDAARVVAARGRAVLGIAGQGGMAAVRRPVSQVANLIDAYAGAITIATVNGPSSTVVSGDTDAIATFIETCRANHIPATRVPIDYASHSSHVDAIRDEFVSSLRGIAPTNSKIPFYSTVTAELFNTVGCDAGYWYRNLRETVRLSDTTSAMHALGCRTFIEAGAHAVLTVDLKDALVRSGAHKTDEPGARVFVTGTLSRGDGGQRRVLESLAGAYAAGVRVAWETVFADLAPRRVKLPTYPFQRRSYWLDPVASHGTDLVPEPVRFKGSDNPRDPQTAADAPPIVRRLANRPVAQQQRLLVDLVQVHAAQVLGHSDASTVTPHRAFRDAGFDSLAAVELRDRLARETGLNLPAGVVFDHPTAAALGRHLHALLPEHTGQGSKRSRASDAENATDADEALFRELEAELSNGSVKHEH